MKTPRLIIREMTVDDLDALYGIYDENVTRYVEGLYEDRKEEEEFTSAYIKNMYCFYGYGIWILQLPNGTVIGRAGISNRNIDGHMELELGYILGSRYQKKGYGLEAVRAITDYAFNELDADAVNCFIKKENLPSVRLAAKSGYSYCGTADCDGVEYIRYVKRKIKE